LATLVIIKIVRIRGFKIQIIQLLGIEGLIIVVWLQDILLKHGRFALEFHVQIKSILLCKDGTMFENLLNEGFFILREVLLMNVVETGLIFK